MTTAAAVTAAATSNSTQVASAAASSTSHIAIAVFKCVILINGTEVLQFVSAFVFAPVAEFITVAVVIRF